MQSFRGAKQSTWVTTVVRVRDQEDLVLIDKLKSHSGCRKSEIGTV